MLQAVLFDMDGVLVDSYEAWFALLCAASRELGGEPVTRARFQATWGQGVDADVQSFFTSSTAQAVNAYYVEHFREHARHVRRIPGASAAIEAVRARGLRIAVVTNTPTPLARDILAGAGLGLDVVVGGSDVPLPKPAPDIVLRACELLAVEPAAAVMVGDSVYDRQAAGAAGVRFIGFGIEGDVTIASLAELGRIAV
jgi:HAD superfamily hydrolase (TIGR01509 family)